MAYSVEFKDYLEDILSPLGPVVGKRMFSGFGLFYRDLMFALCVDDVVYFKVDAVNLPEFEEKNMSAFSYATKHERRGIKSYYRVPDDVLDDEHELLVWARAAADAALRIDAAKTKSKSKSKRRKKG